jgi:threonylcarbamoyladenosine tRNA methylthiotransferase CDKAL1
LTPNDRYNNKKEVVLRVRKRTKRDPQEEVEGDQQHQSIISGTQTVYVKTWGCSHNNSDSEYMAGQLAQFGYNLTNDKSKADVWLLNSCTVKNPSEDTFKNDINSGLKIGKKVVVAGCVPQGELFYTDCHHFHCHPFQVPQSKNISQISALWE